MTKFFAGVLSVIAMGILLVAYGLLNLSASAFDDPRANMEPFARPMNASERMMLPYDPYAARYVYNDGSVAAVPYGYAPYTAQPVGYSTGRRASGAHGGHGAGAAPRRRDANRRPEAEA